MVLDPTPDCPASSVANQTVGSFRNPDDIRHASQHLFAGSLPLQTAKALSASVLKRGVHRRFVEQQKVDVLTMEIEHIDVDALEYVVLHQGVDVQPRPSTLRIIQVARVLSCQEQCLCRACCLLKPQAPLHDVHSETQPVVVTRVNSILSCMPVLTSCQFIQDDCMTAARAQDKLEQKKFFRRNRIPTGTFVPIDSAEDLQEAADQFGFPFMLKSCK